MKDFLYYLAAVMILHWGAVNSLLLISGRYYRAGWPERKILPNTYNLIGMGLSFLAALVFTLAPRSSPGLEICAIFATTCLVADVVLIFKAVKTTP